MNVLNSNKLRINTLKLVILFIFLLVISSYTKNIQVTGQGNKITGFLVYESPLKDVEGNITIRRTKIPTPAAFMSCAENSKTHKIYCFGGSKGSVYLDIIFEYDPTTDTINVKNATLPSPSAYLSCTENSKTHKIYCFGGRDKDIFHNSTLEYDTIKDRILQKNATIQDGRAHWSCSENNKIYCFAGSNNLKMYNEIIEYNPEEDKIVTKNARLPTPRYQVACVKHSSTRRIYCFGGADKKKNETIIQNYRKCLVNTTRTTDCYLEHQDMRDPFVVERINEIIEYNPEENKISVKNAKFLKPGRLYGCAENTLSQEIYCFGGDDAKGPLSEYQYLIKYNPVNDAINFRYLPKNITALACAENSKTHKIYCFGGIVRGSHIDEIFSTHDKV